MSALISDTIELLKLSQANQYYKSEKVIEQTIEVLELLKEKDDNTGENQQNK